MIEDRGRSAGSVARVLGVLALAFGLVGGLGAPAFAAPGFNETIPIEIVVRAPEGSLTQLTSVDVPTEAFGQECRVSSLGTNRQSVHPGNDLLVQSGSSQVVLPNVEGVAGGTVTADGTLTLGDTITVTLDMGPDEVFSAGFDVIVECDPQPGRIVVIKEVTEGSDGSVSFDFAASYDGDGFSLADGQQNDSGDLAPGTYSVSESVPDGWSLTSATCDDGSPVDAIDLASEELVTCTFINDQNPPEPGRIVVVKEVASDFDGSVSFDFAASYDGDGFSLADGQQNDSGDLAPGTYSVSESVPDGWSLTSATCDDGSQTSAIEVSAGETVTCTFVNAIADEVGASIQVTVNAECVDGSEGDAIIDITMSVEEGATVVITDADGDVVGTLTSDGSITVPDGASYSWEATPSEGFEFPEGFESSGTITIESCTSPSTLPFTGAGTEGLGLLASALVAFGALLLASVRTRKSS